MSNLVIFKMVDERQFKISYAHKNIDLSTIIKNTTKKILFSNDSKQKLFDAGDCIEDHKSIDDSKFYIFPIFYIHADNIETLESWKTHVLNMLNEYQQYFSKNNVAICFCDYYESSSHFVKTIEYFADQFSYNFIAITANKKFKTDKKNLKIIYNDTWIVRFPARDTILNFKPKKTYINLNRVARQHRCLLIDALIDNNLLKHGYNTWGDVYENFFRYKEQYPHTKIDKVTFDVLDIENLSTINPNYFVPELQCSRSFIFLNTETSVAADQMFFSEKVYKPIGIGMPFITLGNPGTLDDLRKRGFVTFSEWFDESYDYDLKIESRIQIIINNIKKMSSLDKNEMLKIRQEMNEVLTHNLNLYKILQNKNYLRENLLLYVKDRS